MRISYPWSWWWHFRPGHFPWCDIIWSRLPSDCGSRLPLDRGSRLPLDRRSRLPLHRRSRLPLDRGSQRSEKKILNCILNWKPISSKLYITLNAWKAVLHTSYHFNDDIFDGLTLSDRSSLPIAAPFRSRLPSDRGSLLIAAPFRSQLPSDRGSLPIAAPFWLRITDFFEYQLLIYFAFNTVHFFINQGNIQTMLPTVRFLIHV